MGSSNAVAIIILEPRFAKSIAPTFCISLHMRTQSPHSTHLLGSRTRHGEDRSRGAGVCTGLKRTLVTPTLRATSMSLQSPLLAQLGQLWSWLAKSSSTAILRISRSWGVMTRTTMPGSGGVEQAPITPRFSTSTRHRRQAPYTDSSEW